MTAGNRRRATADHFLELNVVLFCGYFLCLELWSVFPIGTVVVVMAGFFPDYFKNILSLDCVNGLLLFLCSNMALYVKHHFGRQIRDYTIVLIEQYCLSKLRYFKDSNHV